MDEGFKFCSKCKKKSFSHWAQILTYYIYGVDPLLLLHNIESFFDLLRELSQLTRDTWSCSSFDVQPTDVRCHWTASKYCCNAIAVDLTWKQLQQHYCLTHFINWYSNYRQQLVVCFARTRTKSTRRSSTSNSVQMRTATADCDEFE